MDLLKRVGNGVEGYPLHAKIGKGNDIKCFRSVMPKISNIAIGKMKLELKDIGKRYRQQWLFRHIGFALGPGQSLAVTGRNGSGKSTLLQIILGLVQQSEGTVLIDDKTSIDASKIFAMSAPYMELPQEFSIREIHKVYRDLNKTDHTLEAFLAFSGFNSAQSARPTKQFSSGMLQRLKTALCIHSNAPILLLDEPLTNMDKPGEDWYGNCLDLMRSRICIVAGNHPAEYDWTGSTLQLM